MLIGFAGKAASGKTTAARYIINTLGDDICVLPMAAMLRRELDDFFHQVGATEKIPLLYGDQQDKLVEFSVVTQQAVSACPAWGDFIRCNGDIQQLETETTVVTIRRLLQWWGTEYRRRQDPDYWVKAWESAYRQLQSTIRHILVDDVRFPNEAQVIRRNGGVLVRVERAGFNGANDHSSENSLDDFDGWDLVLSNDSSLEAFLKKIDTQVLPLLNHR